MKPPPPADFPLSSLMCVHFLFLLPIPFFFCPSPSCFLFTSPPSLPLPPTRFHPLASTPLPVPLNRNTSSLHATRPSHCSNTPPPATPRSTHLLPSPRKIPTLTSPVPTPPIEQLLTSTPQHHRLVVPPPQPRKQPPTSKLHTSAFRASLGAAVDTSLHHLCIAVAVNPSTRYSVLWKNITNAYSLGLAF
ncbi:extensin-like isoform X4 [Eucalyptus grandis]|uniref:extensin-like isoform X4 n=1 Tax=Eucalyptus grandis TaxID=71139 RepID=UPI00192E8AC6|nr:extensin-like isoform X4 [Eucalyptus grandis]